MFGYIFLIITASLVILNTAVASLAICILALVRMLVPIDAVRRLSSTLANRVMWIWATIKL